MIRTDQIYAGILLVLSIGAVYVDVRADLLEPEVVVDDLDSGSRVGVRVKVRVRV